MTAENFFSQALVYLTAAVVAVPLSKRLGLGSVLGYLIAGIIIGPYVLGFVGQEGGDVLHFAEFGVVMMLFLIGLELRPQHLWEMRVPILGLGGAQVVASAIVITAIAIALGLGWREALVVGMVLALSSTAIVLQTLEEKGLKKTAAGENVFSTLLFQDIAVIPMLAFIPLLGAGEAGAGNGHGHGGPHLEGWQTTLLFVALVLALIGFGRYLASPLFRFVAGSRLREAFTATALLLVIGISMLAQFIGLSPALGAFLAGVALAESEFRRELESDIEPFKGLLLGLFFIAVGASIDFAMLLSMPWAIAGLTSGLVVLKLIVLLGVGRAFQMPPAQNATYSFALAQGGEFAFVLFSFAVQNGALGSEAAQPLVASVALSMMFTPLLFIVNEKLIQPNTMPSEAERQADAVEQSKGVALIVGFGRFGHIVGRALRANGIPLTILDSDPDQVEMLRHLGIKTYFGDGARFDLLEAAGIAEARILVIAVQDHRVSLSIAEQAMKAYPGLEIYVRARGRADAYAFRKLGLKHVYRETLDTSLEMSIDAMRAFGMRAFQARRAAKLFKKLDEQAVDELVEYWGDGDRKVYYHESRKRIENLEAIMRGDQEDWSRPDHAWDSLRLAKEEEVKEKAEGTGG